MQFVALDALRATGRMHPAEGGWVAQPDDVVAALTDEGFEECKSAVARPRRDVGPVAGLWQGLNSATGSVVSAVWVRRPPEAESLIFIDVDGQRVDDH